MFLGAQAAALSLIKSIIFTL